MIQKKASKRRRTVSSTALKIISAKKFYKDNIKCRIGIINVNFPNGIRDDFIDMNKVLKKVLQEAGGHFYFDEFCAASRAIRLDYEVAKIFAASGKSLSLDDLQSELPCVPKEKISAVLDAKKYLPTSAGK